MSRLTLIYLAVIVLLATWAAYLAIDNRSLRAAAAAKPLSRPTAPGTRLPSVGLASTDAQPTVEQHQATAKTAVVSPAPIVASSKPPAPARVAVETDAEGRLLVGTTDGAQLAPLSAETAHSLAQLIQATLLDASATKAGGPSWSPGQTTGPPDTPEHGDYSTAWASEAPDGGAEWLEVHFEHSVEVGEIVIHESYNPGALAKVSALLPDGSYQTLWAGNTPAEGESVERALPVPPGVTSGHLRIELDTSRVPGWNEIDAVQLVGVDGSRQWASEARASSYFGRDRLQESRGNVR